MFFSRLIEKCLLIVLFAIGLISGVIINRFLTVSHLDSLQLENKLLRTEKNDLSEKLSLLGTQVNNIYSTSENEIKYLQNENDALIDKIEQLKHSTQKDRTTKNNQIIYPTYPTYPSMPRYSFLHLGNTVIFPNEYRIFVTEVTSNSITAKLIPRKVNLGSVKPDTTSIESILDKRQKYINNMSENFVKVIIRGITTDPIIPNRYLGIKGYFVVAGKEQIATEKGTETMFILEYSKDNLNAN